MPLEIKIGAVVKCRGFECKITSLLSVGRYVLTPKAPNARPFVANVAELDAIGEPGNPTDGEADPARSIQDVDLELIPAKHVEVARKRFDAIRPLLEKRTSGDVVERGKELKISVSALYRWIALYSQGATLYSLVPEYHRRGGALKSRLDPACEQIVNAAIEELYLTENRLPKRAVAEAVRARCAKAGIEPPCESSVRNRIKALAERAVTRARLGPKAARKLRPLIGTLPGAIRPWSIVHIDHTKIDLEVVDRATRQPIGRPFITLAEDALSRVVVGVYLSLDAPSATSVGICVSQAILPKESLLARRGVEGDWPVWGTPEVIHVDNAREFRSTTMEKGCEMLGISIHFRRAGMPQDGGRVERLISTIGSEIHKLPGTTFSNPKDRGEYPSEQRAALTLDELERLILDWIVNIYHRRGHKGLGGKPPIQVWEDGLLAGAGLGLGLPMRHTAPDRIRLAFLPFVQRTVQPYGVMIDDITYWGEHLTRWVGAKDPKNVKVKRLFLIRRDPRDISRVWFFDPQLMQHFELTYRDISRPVMSLWELREITRKLRAEGAKMINEEMIYAARERMRALTHKAIATTKGALRAKEQDERRHEGAADYIARKEEPVSKPPSRPPAERTEAAFSLGQNFSVDFKS
ncbi:MAG: DDE-type integrase/transposase/recombinase [Verrucomicrobia bacterium]|nr:DDE-type integrase/transposase/recombinase [Verrucomicrobiota bacterium]